MKGIQAKAIECCCREVAEEEEGRLSMEDFQESYSCNHEHEGEIQSWRVPYPNIGQMVTLF